MPINGVRLMMSRGSWKKKTDELKIDVNSKWGITKIHIGMAAADIDIGTRYFYKFIITNMIDGPKTSPLQLTTMFANFINSKVFH